MDEMDGDPDAESDDEDTCQAGDDQITGNTALGYEDDRNGDDDTEVGSIPEGICGGAVIADDADEDDGAAIWHKHRYRITASERRRSNKLKQNV